MGSDGACVPVACGADRWGPVEPDEDAIFVDTAASEGGTGSTRRPFRTVAEGLAARRASGPGEVWLAAGTYSETVALGEADSGLVLRGRCAALVTLDGGVAEAPTLSLAGAGSVEVQDVRVTGGEVGLRVEGGSLRGTGLDVTEAGWGGVYATGAGTELHLADSSVRGTLPGASGSAYPLIVADGATAEVSGADIGESGPFGVAVVGAGSRLVLDEADVHDLHAVVTNDTGYGSTDLSATGVLAFDGADLEVSGGTIRTVEGVGVAVGDGARDPSTTVRLDALVVSDLLPYPVDLGGVPSEASWGLVAAASPATITLTDTIVRDVTVGIQVGAEGADAGPEVTLAATEITNAATTPGITAVAVWSAETFTATGLDVAGPWSDALFFSGSSVRADVGGLTLALDGCPEGCGGLWVDGDARVELTDLVVSGASGAVLAATAGGRLTVTGADVSGVTPVTDTEGLVHGAIGAFVDGGRLTLEDVDLREVPGIAVAVAAGSATLRSATVSATNGAFGAGYGVWVQSDDEPAEATIEACTLAGYGKTGVFVFGPLATATVTDTTISDGQGDGSGWDAGMVAYGGATLTGVGVEILRPFGAGVIVLGGSEATEQGLPTAADLEDVDVTDVVGADGQTPAGVVVSGSFAQLTGSDLHISGVPGPGAFVEGGTLLLYSGTISDVSFAGAASYNGGGLGLFDDPDTGRGATRIEGVHADAVLGGGVGVLALSGPNVVVLDGVEVEDTVLTGVMLVGPGSYVLHDADITAATPVEVGGQPLNGNGLFVLDGVTPWDAETEEGLLVETTDFHGAAEVAVLLHGASASFDAGVDFAGDFGADVVWQGCVDDVPAPEGVDPDWSVEACPTDPYGYLDPAGLGFYYTYEEPEPQSWSG